MSLPNVPNVTPIISLNHHETLNLLLASIALEEIGLSHILNAEGEKLQHFLSTCPTNFKDYMHINNSINETLRNVAKNQMLLHFKLEDVLSLKSRSNLEHYDDCNCVEFRDKHGNDCQCMECCNQHNNDCYCVECRDKHGNDYQCMECCNQHNNDCNCVEFRDKHGNDCQCMECCNKRNNDCYCVECRNKHDNDCQCMECYVKFCKHNQTNYKKYKQTKRRR
ncbi:hypothetical protein [Bacillus cereus]|uniref:hypothetical protein n=1 Tax=Bacillus cereus TaxID=1396 RepID=UPI001F5C420D|nr:hypothetical protein [Bacillus cereus]